MIRKVAPLALAGSLALAGCGAGTEAQSVKPSRLTDGVNISQGGLDVRNMFVLGPVPGTPSAPGVDLPLYGTLINNTAKESDALTSVTAAGGFVQSAEVGGGSIALPAHTAVRLGGPQTSVVLKGTSAKLFGGESVKLTLTFSGAPQITVTVPVVPSVGEYATLAPAPAATPTGSATPTGTPTAPATGGIEGTPASNPKPTKTPKTAKPTNETSEH
ncbi:hypothetical protein GCM10022221_16530 [Actinocorallia aurea]